MEESFPGSDETVIENMPAEGISEKETEVVASKEVKGDHEIV